MQAYNKKLYNVWHSAKRRCNNTSDKNYAQYGGRGIRMCKAWLDDRHVFEKWAYANGWKAGLTIDRIDNGKGYTPTNCRFVTVRENTLNQRRLNSLNTSGYRDVSFQTKQNRWTAVIRINQVRTYCGCYKTKEEAAAAVRLAETCDTSAEARALLAVGVFTGFRQDKSYNDLVAIDQ